MKIKDLFVKGNNKKDLFNVVYKISTLDDTYTLDKIFESRVEATKFVAQLNFKELHSTNNKSYKGKNDFYKVVPCEYYFTPITNNNPTESIALNLLNNKSLPQFHWVNIDLSNMGKGNNFNPSYIFSFESLIKDNPTVTIDILDDFFIYSDNYPILTIFAVYKDLLLSLTKTLITEFLSQYSQHMQLDKIDLVEIDDLKSPMIEYINNLNNKDILFSMS